MRKAIVLILLIVCIGGGALADLYVHFLDVEQGDAAIIIADEAVMMIDGGRREAFQPHLYLPPRHAEK